MAKYQITVRGRTFPCKDDENILDAAENAGVSLPYSCRSGSCAECLCMLADGTVDQGDGTFLTPTQKSRGLVSACVALPETDVRLNVVSDELKALIQQDAPYEIDNNTDASWHYFFGEGRPVNIGPDTCFMLEGHPRQLEALANLFIGDTTKSGNYAVDMTSYMFHIGHTTVAYTTVCSGGTCTTTFTGFVRKVGSGFAPDGVWDVMDLEEYFGIQGVEIPYGTPYEYIPHIWTETYPDNFTNND